MATAKTGVRQRRKDARPAEMVEAALDVFAERGFAATRLEEIADRVGVSKGTLYLYFDSKEALFKAVVEGGFVPALAEGEALLEAGKEDPERLLRELLRGWWDLVGNTRLAGIAKLMIAESSNFPELTEHYRQNVIERGHRLMVAVLELGMARGVFRRQSTELLCHVAFAPMLMASLWRQSFGMCCKEDMNYDDYIAMHLDLLMRGLLQEKSQ
ncbi:MAG: TetR/AcrR family transcriptional regulator [Rhodocyclaceae bacterium]